MLYLESFTFPDIEDDTLLKHPDSNIGSFYTENAYPFHITSQMGLWQLDFEPITMLYGGNGSGKSTIINVISSKLGAKREAMFNVGYFFKDYLSKCCFKVAKGLDTETTYKGRGRLQKHDIASITTVLTSDDIFDHMLNLRLNNDNKLQKSKFLFDEYNNPDPLPKYLNLETGYNVETYKKGVEIRRSQKRGSFNKYLIDKVGKTERGFSNGETALMRLSELLEKPGLYLLDEPENSMSCEFQIKLSSIIEYLVRYGNCQFIISTHSPFLLSIKNAKIYNLDHYPVNICKWYELENMKRYFTLFEENRDSFLKV